MLGSAKVTISKDMTQLYLMVGLTRKALRGDVNKYIQIHNFISIFLVECVLVSIESIIYKIVQITPPTMCG
jgi:hypothetical protein